MRQVGVRNSKSSSEIRFNCGQILRRACKPLVESLEGRVLLAVFWAKDESGFWDDPTNWDTGIVPGSGDDVVIDRADANPTVTIRDGRSVRSLVSHEAVSMFAGSLTIAEASEIDAALSFGGGQISSSTSLSLNGQTTWTGGAFAGSIVSAGTLTLAGGDVSLNGGTLGNTGTVVHSSGRLLLGGGTVNNLAGGTWDFQNAGTASVTNNGGSNAFNNSGILLKSSGGGAIRFETALNNSPTSSIDVRSASLTWAAGGENSGGSFAVASGATLDLTGGSSVHFTGSYSGSGAGTISLASGTLNVSGGASFDFTEGLFRWSGGQVASGTLSNAGFITVAGGDVNLNGATLANTGTIIHSSGRALLGGGTIENQSTGVYDYRNEVGVTIINNGGSNAFRNFGILRKSSGSAPALMQVPFHNDAAGVIEVQSGQVSLAGGGDSTGGTFTVASGTTLQLAAGSDIHFSGSYVGSGGGTVLLASNGLNVSGDASFNFPDGMFRWTGGQITGGTLTNAGFITIAGGDLNLNGATLTNMETITQTSGRVLLGGGTVNNLAGGTWDFQNAGTASVTNNGGSNNFNNSGALLKSSGGGAVRFETALNNGSGGTLDVRSASLAWAAGGENAGGTFVVAVGATLDLTGGSSVHFTGSYSGSGAGVISLASGTVNVSGGASFDFAEGLFRWSGGQIASGTLSNVGWITIAGGDVNLNGATLANTGTIIHSSGRMLLGGGTINNGAAGLWEIEADASIVNNGGSNAFNNSGTIRKTAGTGTFSMAVPFYNAAPEETVPATLDIRSGTLALSGGGSSQGGRFLFDDGGVLDLTGGNTNVFQGTYTGSGRGAVLLQSGTLNTGDNGATFNFPAGIVQWTGGAIDGAGGLTNSGVMSILGGDKSLNGSHLENSGRVAFVAGRLLLGGGTVNNLAGGRWDFQNAGTASVTNNGGSNAFNNSGTLLKSSGGGAVRFETALNNSPTSSIDVRSASLAWAAGGENTGGTFTVAANATLDLTGGSSVHFTGSYSGSGAGTISLSSGTLNVSGDASFDFSEGLFRWSGGQVIGGTLSNVDYMTIAGGDVNLNAGALANTGTVTHSSGRVLMSGSTINNLAGGTWDFQNAGTASVTNNGWTNNFNNSGILLKSSGGGAVRFETPLNNSPGGSIDVRSASLAWAAGGEDTGGTFTVAADASLDLTGGSSVHFTGSYSGSGAGVISLSSGTLNVSGDASFDFSEGLFRWSGGQVTGGTLSNVGHITIAGGDVNLNSATLANAGTIAHSSGRVLLGGGTINNGATGLWELRTGTSIVNNGGSNSFANAGTLRKTDTGSANIDPAYSSSGTTEVTGGSLSLNGAVSQFATSTLSEGTWNVLNGSTLAVQGSNITTNAASVTLHGAGATLARINTLSSNSGNLRLTGGRAFSTSGAFTNSGTLVLGGAFTVNGGFTQSEGTLEVQLAGPPGSGNFGRLISTGTATLAGTLDLSLTGGYGPAAGQVFTILSFPSRSGSFSTTTGLSIGNVQYLRTDLTTDKVTVTTLANSADLRATAITVPSSALVGNPITIGYTVRNTEATPTLADAWNDSIYLSSDDVLDGSDLLLGIVRHTGSLVSNATYSGSLTATVPGLLPSSYRVLVAVDSGGEVPDSNRVNNVTASSGAVSLDMSRISDGTPATLATEPGQDSYYRFDPAAGLDLELSLVFAAADQADVYIRQGALPDPTHYDQAVSNGSDLLKKLYLLNTSATPYYILIRGRAGATGGQSLGISARQLGFEIISASPSTLANLGESDVTLSGSHFTAGTAVRLVSATGATLTPLSTQFQNSNTMMARFDFTGVVPGLFDVVIDDGGAQAPLYGGTRVIYAQSNHSGTISSDESWFGTLVHRVTGNIVVPAGVTLTIDPGAIVKFEPFTGIVVQAGGRLIASGSFAQPVVFTSFADDAHGGDTNNDGESTLPAAGNWRWIYVEGRADFDHAQLLYGGGTLSGGWEGTGNIRMGGNATVNFTNSLMSQSLFDGILNWGGTATVTNSVFTAIDRALSAHPSGTIHVLNSTFDDNRIALLVHGGSLDVSNSTVTNSILSGVQYDFGAPATVRYTDVYSTVPNSANYRNMPDLTGSDGNISADPIYRNRAAGDFRLDFGSPAIDAADGAVAPETDHAGISRYDDPRTANSGTATATDAYADLGAFEFVLSAPANVDLTVIDIAAPPAVIAGQTARITWTVRNNGTGTLSGTWHDTIQLVSVTGEVVLDAGVAVSSATLSAGQTATFSTTIRIPYGTEGNYRWRVRTNSAGEIFEGQNYGNNSTDSLARSALSVPTLTLGTPAAGGFETVGKGVLYKLTPAAGSDVLLTVHRADGGGATDIYIGLGKAPTPQSFFDRATATNGADVTLAIDSAQDTDYYVLVVPRSLPQGAAAFTLSGTVVAFSLNSIDVSEGSNTGQITVPLRGAQFRSGMSAALVGPDNAAYPARSLTIANSTLAYATFDLTGLPVGVYSVGVYRNGAKRTLANSFRVIAGVAGQLDTQIILPARVRVGREFTAYVEYTNTGDADMPGPILVIQSPSGNLMRLDREDGYTDKLSFLAVSPDGAAGILRPSQTVTVPIYVSAIEGDNVLTITNSTQTNDPYDWSALKAAIRPDTPDPEWDTVFDTVVKGSRTTSAEYVQLLSEAATLHATRTGAPSSDIATIFNTYILNQLINRRTDLRGYAYLGDTLHPLGNAVVAARNTQTNVTDTTVSTADGLVRFTNLPAGSYTLEFLGFVAPANLAPVTVAGGGAGPWQSWIVQPGGQIAGRVSAPAGFDFTADPSVVVSAENEDGMLFRAEVDASGAYLLKGLPAGNYRLSISSPRLATPAPLGGIQVRAGQTVAVADLLTSSGGTVSGIVRRASDNQPVANATVTLFDGSDPQVVTTDANGAYTFLYVPAGTHTIAVTANGFVRQTLTGVEVANGQTTADQDIALSTGASITGTVCFGENPVARAGIQLLSGDTPVAYALTDAQGQFALANLPAGVYTLQVDAPLHALAIAEIELAGGQVLTQDVTLDSTAVIQGFVRQAANSAAMSGVVVYLLKPDGALQSMATSTDGAYSFSRLDPGHYTVMLPDGSNRYEFDIAGADTSLTHDFSLSVGTLSGNVLLPDGTPNDQAVVVLLKNGRVMWQTETRADGAYNLALITPGSYDLAVADGRYDYAIRTGVIVYANANKAVANFTPGTSTLQLRIVDTATGQSVGYGGALNLNQLGLPANGQLGNSASVPPSGVVSISNLAPGQYLLQVSVAGKAYTQTVLTIAAGANTATVQVADAATLSGAVDDGTSGIEGLSITVYSPAVPQALWQTTTDEQGGYSLDRLPPGSYTLVVSDNREGAAAPRYAVATVTGLTLTAAAPLTQDLTLDASTITVSGSVGDAAGNLPSSGVVRALNADGVEVARTTIDLTGHFTFANLAAGSYTLDALAYGFVVGTLPLTVEAGQTIDNADLSATWYVDPPPPQPIEPSGPGFVQSVLDGLAYLMGEPRREPGITPPVGLEDCLLAQKWWRIAQQYDLIANGVFDAWKMRWESQVDLVSADVGLFGVNLGLFAAQLWSGRAGLSTSWFNSYNAAKTEILAIECADDAAVAFQVAKLHNLDSLFLQMKYMMGLDAAGGAIGNGIQGVAGTATGQTPTVWDVWKSMKDFAAEPSWGGFFNMIGGINNYVGALNSLVQALYGLRGSLPPGFTNAIANVSSALNAIVSAGQVLLTAANGIKDLGEYEQNYQKWIGKRNTAAAYAQSAAIECIYRKNNQTPPGEPTPWPPPNVFVRPGRFDTPSVGSHDPNDKLTIGYGPQGFIRPGQTISYTIDFENVPNATAAAQQVTITDPLSSNLDWSTLQLTSIAFNGVVLSLPAGVTSYETITQVSTDPNPVRVQVSFDPDTGVLTWLMESFDSITGELPEDPLAGFLPPNNDQHQGEGYVTYTIEPRANIDGVAITNQARIVFDVNAPIDTPVTTNTVDGVAPTSAVAALPKTAASTRFTVSWAGADGENGSGIAGYDVYVSIDGAPYTLWLNDTVNTSATYRGLPGHAYAFISVATDNIGNAEAIPPKADARTRTPGLRTFAKASYNSMAYDSAGRIYLAYYDTSSHKLNFAVRGRDRFWSGVSVVDSSSHDTGQFVSLAIDPAGMPAVAYYDATSGNLRFARYDGSTWAITTIDASGDVGLYPSLKFDPSGKAAISYYDRTRGALKLATLGAKWSTRIIDTADDSGQYSSLAYNPATGKWAIAYQNTTRGQLRYAEQNVRNKWTFSTIDIVQGGQRNISLAFDANKAPAIAYHTPKTSDLKFAHSIAGQWMVQTVAAKGSQGLFSRLLIDRGKARILYGAGKTLAQAVGDVGSWNFSTVRTGAASNIFAASSGGTAKAIAWTDAKSTLHVEDF